MPGPLPKHIVVDACVAQQCGVQEPPKAESKPCRDFLTAMLGTKHVLAMSGALGDEWRRHATSYATHWYADMLARRRVARWSPPELPDARQAVEAFLSDPADCAEALKDWHLVLVADVKDRTIVSVDRKARFRFARCAQGANVPELMRLVWVNPDDGADADDQTEFDAVLWVRDGARPEEHRKLANYPLRGHTP